MSGNATALGADLPAGFTTTCMELQRVATHILSRGRAGDAGRIGLRATTTGIATPMFGTHGTVLRLAGTVLVKEHEGDQGPVVDVLDLEGRTLADAAEFARVDLGAPFDPGSDAPAVGDTTARLDLDAGVVDLVWSWFAIGAASLDVVLPVLVGPTVAQVWPEHFDIGLVAATGSGGVNLGACPGDADVNEPYFYIAPWESVRPGDPEFWNAPFGAVLTRSALAASGNPAATGGRFFVKGLTMLGPA